MASACCSELGLKGSELPLCNHVLDSNPDFSLRQEPSCRKDLQVVACGSPC